MSGELVTKVSIASSLDDGILGDFDFLGGFFCCYLFVIFKSFTINIYEHGKKNILKIKKKKYPQGEGTLL